MRFNLESGLNNKIVRANEFYIFALKFDLGLKNYYNTRVSSRQANAKVCYRVHFDLNKSTIKL